jgi:hypothetical protein
LTIPGIPPARQSPACCTSARRRALGHAKKGALLPCWCPFSCADYLIRYINIPEPEKSSGKEDAGKEELITDRSSCRRIVTLGCESQRQRYRKRHGGQAGETEQSFLSLFMGVMTTFVVGKYMEYGPFRRVLLHAIAVFLSLQVSGNPSAGSMGHV